MISYVLQYEKLMPQDQDIPFLREIHNLPELRRFIGIDDQNYFHYVSSTEHVSYFKVLFQNEIVATVHLEQQEDVLYLSILTLPQYQRRGVATQILRDIQYRKLVQGFSEIVVFIHKENRSSIGLFEKAGFVFRSEEDGLLEYRNCEVLQ